MEKLRKEGMTFFVTAQCDIRNTKPLNIEGDRQIPFGNVSNTSLSKDNGMKLPKFMFKLGSLGKSSIFIVGSIDSGEPGGNGVYFALKYVFVDRTTRKSIPLPIWFKEANKHSMADVAQMIAVPSYPSNREYVIVAPVTVTEKDMDHFGHLNHAAYVDMAVEGIKTYFRENDIDEVGSIVDCLNVHYFGESRTGDQLYVKVYKPESHTAPWWFCSIVTEERTLVHVTFRLLTDKTN